MKKAFFIPLMVIQTGLSAQWTDNGSSITTTDNVGIGTSNPSEKLDVYGNISTNDGDIILANSTINQEDSGTIRWNEYDNGNPNKSGAFIRYNGNNNYLQFLTNNETTDYEHIRIYRGGHVSFQQTSGNVGIGTSTPEHKLTLNGGMFSIGDGGSGIPFKIWAGSSGSNNHLRIGSDVGHYGDGVVELYQNYSGGSGQNPGKLVVNGNMGIGTKNPDARLAVNGDIHAKEVKVDLVGWPDYVFNKDHELPTLEEVETHIKEKGHLQDIPSAQEVAENGIQLGEMNAKLLQKIEELMLYTIAQQKEIQKLKEEINILREGQK